MKKINALFGDSIPEKEVIEILSALYFSPEKKKKDIVVTVPTYRRDILSWQDFSEEVGRVHGYERITSVPPIAAVSPPLRNDERIFTAATKDALVSQGFSEIYSYSFYNLSDASAIGRMEENHLSLAKPMSADQTLLRTSILPSVVKSIVRNRRNFDTVRIFEIGHIYLLQKDALPEEKQMLFGAIAQSKDIKGEGFYDMKSVVENLLQRRGISGYSFVLPKEEEKNMHKGRSAEIVVGRTRVGVVGEIHPAIAVAFGSKDRMTIFEIDLEKLRSVARDEREYTPLLKYPTAIRDISMLIPVAVTVDDILQDMQTAGGKIIVDVNLFDFFESEEKKQKSLAFHIIFGADDHTLQSEEIDRVMKNITTSLESKLGVRVRR